MVKFNVIAQEVLLDVTGIMEDNDTVAQEVL